MDSGVSYAPAKDGWFVSDFYLEQVMKARVNK
jgi:hypothetical protein